MYTIVRNLKNNQVFKKKCQVIPEKACLIQYDTTITFIF
jgi:hypothetical protein